MNKPYQKAIMQRWNNRTSFMSRLSRQYPTFSFRGLSKLLKDRARSTYVCKFIRDVIDQDLMLAWKKMRYPLKFQFWTNPWWRTWKSQWCVASNQSLRKFYGLPVDKEIPLFLFHWSSRVTLPTARELHTWKDNGAPPQQTAPPKNDRMT